MAEETNQDKTDAAPEGVAGKAVEPLSPPQPAGPPADELAKKLEEAQKLAETYKDQLLRKAAEFENYRKRTDADFTNLIRNANEELMTLLLPILNDITRSLTSGKEQKDYDAFYRGVELIHSKLLKVLEGQGLTRFSSVGQQFDVQFHDALLQVPRADVPPHTVVQEVEPGYKLNDKVLRHAKVIVSAAEELPPPDADRHTEPSTIPKDGERKEREND